jgi:hypothetical protein
MLVPEKKILKDFTFGPHLFTVEYPAAVHCCLSRPPFV